METCTCYLISHSRRVEARPRGQGARRWAADAACGGHTGGHGRAGTPERRDVPEKRLPQLRSGFLPTSLNEDTMSATRGSAWRVLCCRGNSSAFQTLALYGHFVKLLILCYFILVTTNQNKFFSINGGTDLQRLAKCSAQVSGEARSSTRCPGSVPPHVSTSETHATSVMLQGPGCGPRVQGARRAHHQVPPAWGSACVSRPLFPVALTLSTRYISLSITFLL